jgi:hypothetical protein
MRMMLAGATGLVMAAAFAGCGDDEPTAAEQRAAKARWIQRVDGACRKANAAIAERGYPADLVDLDRLVVRGIGDVRGAIHAIARERVPEAAGPRPGAFVRELKGLDPELSDLSEASEDLDPHALVRAADELKPRLAGLQKSAEAAGLRDCLTHDERFFIPDAVRAPVFAEQLARLERSLLRRIRSINFAQASSPGEFARAFDRYSELIDDALDGIDKLDPPLWAADQTASYQEALRDLQAASQKFAARLAQDRGKPLSVLDRAAYLRIQRQLDKASVAETKARRKMLRAVGAAPTTPPSAGGGGEDAVEPESTEQS